MRTLCYLNFSNKTFCSSVVFRSQNNGFQMNINVTLTLKKNHCQMLQLAPCTHICRRINVDSMLIKRCVSSGQYCCMKRASQQVLASQMTHE